MKRIAVLALAACSSSPAPTKPTPAPPPDAAVDTALPPDAPAPDAELAAAPAQVFRYQATGAAPRFETWTLRTVGNRAVVLVERKTPNATTSLYLGSATDDGKTLTLALADRTDKLSLVCKRDKLPVVPAGAQPKACKWPKATSIDVLQCKHPDFAAPMPFAAAPGVEYVVLEGCEGSYRKL